MRMYAAARAAAKVEQIEVTTGTLAEILDKLIEEFPDLANVIPQCSFLVNEAACRDQMTPIIGGSLIDILPRFAGGAL